jgi:hypothetical protein
MKNSKTPLLALAAVALVLGSLQVGRAVTLSDNAVTFADGTRLTSGLQFVGVTTAIGGDAGVLEMTRRCQLEYGAGTRMCSSLEIMNTIDLPAKTVWQLNKAWVRPNFGISTDSSGLVVVDASGVSTDDANDFSCGGGWVNTTDTGLIAEAPDLGREGQFDVEACNSSNVGVACCGG